MADIIKIAEKAGFYFHNAGYAPILHTVSGEYSQMCFERFAEMIRKDALSAFDQGANAKLIAAVPDLLEFAEEVRRTGDTRLASIAIAVINKTKGN